MNLLPLPPVLILCIAFLTACTSQGQQNGGGQEEILVSVQGTNLTRADLDAALPKGLAPDDSVRQAKAYIRSWLNTALLDAAAEKTLSDTEEIDRLVSEYRRELIAREYISRKVSSTLASTISPDSVEAYYARHKEQFPLRRAVVKGIYIKVPEKFPQLREIKRLMSSDKVADLDRLEKLAYNRDVTYDYFRDRWTDVEQIELAIPFDAATDPASYLRANRNVEIRQGGFVYLLHITSFMEAGETAPLEIAEERIRQAMEFERRAEIERTLSLDLLREAEERGELKINVEL